MIPNPIQLQTEKTIWSDSMLEPPDGVLGSDVLFSEKQKKGGKMRSVRSEALFKDNEKGQWSLSLPLCFYAGLGDLGTWLCKLSSTNLHSSQSFPSV